MLTAGVFREGYRKGKRLLWEAERRSGLAADDGESPSMRGSQSSDDTLCQEAPAGNAPDGGGHRHRREHASSYSAIVQSSEDGLLIFPKTLYRIYFLVGALGLEPKTL